MSEGISQKDAAETLGISPGQVSKIRTKAIKDELLTPKNKLTASGNTLVFGSE